MCRSPVQVTRGGEAPRATDAHPDPDALVLAVAQVVERSVARRDVLAARMHEARIGIRTLARRSVDQVLEQVLDAR